MVLHLLQCPVGVDDMVAVTVLEACHQTGGLDGDSAKIHAAFHQFRNHVPLLENRLPFSETGVTPFCSILEESLSILETAGMLRMDGEFERYIASPGGLQFVRTYLVPLFTPEEQAQLRTVARALALACTPCPPDNA